MADAQVQMLAGLFSQTISSTSPVITIPAAAMSSCRCP